MLIYSLMLGKLALGLLCLILQINLLGKGNLAPNSATDQVQNYVLGGIIGGVIYNMPSRFWISCSCSSRGRCSC